jgi:hypothetical protein
MEASQITKLLQKQSNRHIQRPQTVDSSTLTWKQQLQSSTHVHGLHTTQSAPSCCETSGQRYYGGQGKQTTLITGSTQQYPNVLASASGSASEVYSADRLLLQKAGKHACAIQTELTGSIELPPCFCQNTNVPDPTSAQINPQTNPYLPAFDTYYRFKNQLHSQAIPDANLKHHVPTCHSRFLRNDASYACSTDSQSPTTCNGCILEQR